MSTKMIGTGGRLQTMRGAASDARVVLRRTEPSRTSAGIRKLSGGVTPG